MQIIPSSRRRTGAMLHIAVYLILIGGTLFFIDSYLRPIVKTMAAYQAKVYATCAINNTVADYLNEWGTGSHRIIEVTYGAAGEVSTIQTDMVALNRLKAEITQAVTEEIIKLEEQSMKIPVGTLLGGQVFSGRGPGVTFKILPAGYVETNIVNHFDSAGINQTRHQIYIEITASVVAILPGYTSSTEVTTSICVAETVIIGAVPGTFAEFNMGESGRIPFVAGAGG